MVLRLPRSIHDWALGKDKARGEPRLLSLRTSTIIAEHRYQTTYLLFARYLIGFSLSTEF